MTEHILKTWPQYWDAIERGDKTFEVRRDDRGFQRGDILVLRRTRSEAPYSFDVKNFGGHDYATNAWRPTEFYDLRRLIIYVLTGGQLGIEPGHVVLGLAPERAKKVSPSTPQSIGGHARAASLSSEERSEIARAAANARWKCPA